MERKTLTYSFDPNKKRLQVGNVVLTIVPDGRRLKVKAENPDQHIKLISRNDEDVGSRRPTSVKGATK